MRLIFQSVVFFGFSVLLAQDVKVIVLEFDSHGANVTEDDGVIVANAFRSYFADMTEDTEVFLIEKDKIDEILIEISEYESLSGLYDDRDIVKIGSFRKADYIIVGSVAKSDILFDGVSISARIIDIRTGEIKKAKERIYTEPSEFHKVKARIANELLNYINGNESIKEYDLNCLEVNINSLLSSSNRYTRYYSSLEYIDANHSKITENILELGLQNFGSETIGLLKAHNFGLLLSDLGISWKIKQSYRCPENVIDDYDEIEHWPAFESSGVLSWEDLDYAEIRIEEYEYEQKYRQDYYQRKASVSSIKTFRLLINDIVIVNDHYCFENPDLFKIKDIFVVLTSCSVY